MCRRSRVISQSEMSRPSTATRPSLTLSRPLISLSVVVLPEPLGPSSMRISPRATERVRSARSTRFPLVRNPACSNSIAHGGSFIAIVPSHVPAGYPQLVHGAGLRQGCLLLDQPIRDARRCGFILRRTPFPYVVQGDSDAEGVRRHKTPLSGLDPDTRNDGAVRSSHHPALPLAPAHHHGGKNRQQARKIIESQHQQVRGNPEFLLSVVRHATSAATSEKDSSCVSVFTGDGNHTKGGPLAPSIKTPA